MDKITISMLKKAAKAILLDMSASEYEVLAQEFDILLRQMDLIGNIKGIDDTVPMTFPFEAATSWMRPDEPVPPEPASDILKNAGTTLADQIKVPKVVG